jgi:RNA polymerase sigma-70 factor, ECF subfamily
MQEKNQKVAEFMSLFTQHQRGMATYIHSLVSHWSDAEDLLQETNLRLWEQFDKYSPDTNFYAWACTIAHFLVVAYRNRMAADRVHFSQECLDVIADKVATLSDRIEERQRLLAGCLEKLSSSSRELLRLLYVDGIKPQQIAARLGRKVAAIYMSISRIRSGLHRCIEKAQSKESSP